MTKTLLAAALIMASVSASAQTIKSCAGISWDYPEESLPLIDGFTVYVNGAIAGSVPSSQQNIGCSDVGLDTSGIFVVTVTAYNAAGESPKSDPLSLSVVTTAPAAPTGLTAN